MTGFGRLASGRLVVLVLLLSAQPARALDWIVLVVDRSNSVTREQLSLQRQAYAAVLRDEGIAEMLRDAGVAIVEFDSTAEVVVPWTTAADAAARYEGWDPAGLRGGTAIGEGLRAAMDLLAGKDGRRVIDVSGDGRDNRDPRLLDEMLVRATRSGIEVNGLVLLEGTRNQVEAYYRERVANGFVISVDRREDFERSLKQKIGLEAQVSRWLPRPARERPVATD